MAKRFELRLQALLWEKNAAPPMTNAAQAARAGILYGTIMSTEMVIIIMTMSRKASSAGGIGKSNFPVCGYQYFGFVFC